MCGYMRVVYTMCMCTRLKRSEGIGCFPGVATDLMCVLKGQRIMVEAKEQLKDKYQCFISVLLCIWSITLIYDGYI